MQSAHSQMPEAVWVLCRVKSGRNKNTANQPPISSNDRATTYHLLPFTNIKK